MKKWLPNLLLVLSVILCTLIAIQWVREARLRGLLQAKQVEVEARDKKLGELDGRLKLLEVELKRLDGLKAELTEQNKKSIGETSGLQRELAEAERKLRSAEAANAAYKKALDDANANIKKQNAAVQGQNEQIQKQNEAVKKQNGVIEQLNGEVQRLAKERNEVVEKYNQLVKDYEVLVKRLEEAAKTEKK